MPSGLANKKAMMWVVNWGRAGGFPGGNVRWAYRLPLRLDSRFLVRR